MTLLAQQLCAADQVFLHHAAWYQKPQATFSDTIASVRRWHWSHEYFSVSSNETDMVKIPRPLVDRLIDSLCELRNPRHQQLAEATAALY